MKDDLTRNISGSDSAKLCLTTPQERTTYPPPLRDPKKNGRQVWRKGKRKDLTP
uniref:Uncharacterized protein n=1 Tax=Candidatus Kentrum sp. FW TaxID=2126338 RepID=A0A450SBB4_9GAMM|nr:MAG: hypothetical protein BECKFW1821A_GA0114235_102329 [Candidatus Kentron sp. FW]